MDSGEDTLTQDANEGSEGSGVHRPPGSAGHLSEAAIVLLIERILAGDTNRRINVALQRAGHLQIGQELSRTTLAEYRRDPRARIAINRLSDEAVMAGHALLSRSIAQAVETAIALDEKILDIESGDLVAYDNPRTLKIYSDLRNKHWQFVWDKFGRPELLEEVLKSEAAIVNTLKTAPGLTELEKREIILQVKRNFAEILRRTVQQAAAGGAPPAYPQEEDQ